MLRDLPLSQIISATKQRLASEYDWWEALLPERVQELTDLANELRRQARARGGRPKLDPKIYRDAAGIYEAALNRGASPRQAVVDEMHVAESTASRYIREARRLGFLPPTTRGKARAGSPRTNEGEDGDE